MLVLATHPSSWSCELNLNSPPGRRLLLKNLSFSFSGLLSQIDTHVVAAHILSDKIMALTTWLALLVTEGHVWSLRCLVCKWWKTRQKYLVARPGRRKQFVSSQSCLASPAERKPVAGPHNLTVIMITNIRIWRNAAWKTQRYYFNPLSHNHAWERAQYINSEAQVDRLVYIWHPTRCIKSAHLWLH